jgi:hypothetical protein
MEVRAIRNDFVMLQCQTSTSAEASASSSTENFAPNLAPQKAQNSNRLTFAP